MPDRELQLFEEVLAKTKAGKIRWQPTADPSRFIAPFGGKFTLDVEEWPSPSGEGYLYGLMLKDVENVELTRVTNSHKNISWAALEELFDIARRQALRVDEKLDSALAALQKL